MDKNCLEMVRQHDPDRFLISLMCDSRSRPALWPLFAFNYEIAKTAEVVSEEITARIRFQWWRDALAEIYDGKEPRRHEVVTPLARTIKNYALPQETLLAMIDAREAAYGKDAFATLDDMKAQARAVNEPILRAALSITGERETQETLEAVSILYGLIGMVRAVPFGMADNRLMLPADIMARHEASRTKVMDFRQTSILPPVIRDVVEIAPTALPRSRLLKAAQKSALVHKRHIEKCGYDLFDARLRVPPPALALRVWLGSR
jgi:phytoene synthase